MGRILGGAAVAFALAYAGALAIFAIGALGLFGQPEDPLSGVYLILLGLPWNRGADAFSEAWRPALAAAAPAVNLLILVMLTRAARRR